MSILSILVAVLMFGALIAIHEFGHFIAAKSLGVRVNEFAIGMGPLVFSRQKGETLYSLRALPIGGFCAMEGEEESSDDPASFSNKPAWKKFLILAAGAFFNFVTGLVLILILFSVMGSPQAPVLVGSMPGAEDIWDTGLREGDVLYRIDGHRIYFKNDALLYLSRAGDEVAVEVVRDGERVDLGVLSLPYRQLTQEDGTQTWKRGLLVGAGQEEGLWPAVKSAWYQAIDYVRMVWMGLGDLLTGAVGLREMSGPIGIVDMIGQVSEAGAQSAGFLGAVLSVLDFVAFIAINLAVMNLLPIPALDGGQILFLAVGGVWRFFTKKRIDQKYLSYINMAGFACLLALMAVVAVNDVFKLL